MSGDACPLCQCPLADGEEVMRCPGCGTPSHRTCWDEIGGCGVYGCARVPPTEKLGELEIPAGHWGKDHKDCPACGQQILAAAVRCRHCGATFASAAPQSRLAYDLGLNARSERPHLKRRIIWLFVGSAIPCTTTFAGLIGLVFWLRRRAEIAALPGLYGALCIISLGLSALLTLGFSLAIVTAILFG